MADDLKVYLDHLIERESFRYRQPVLEMNNPPNIHELRMDDLAKTYDTRIRKPDFQRSTSAWTPEDCVSLLETIINGQVVPSIIMWKNPNNTYDYVLDGGHRVSVVLAWIRDDWGDKLPPDRYRDEEEESRYRAAAREVRALVQARVGNIKEYIEADREIVRINREGGNPKQQMKGDTFQKGLFYRDFAKGYISFPILWVKGDYQQAETSFLKINKSGRQLSTWETRLIENRNSSFARTVMSVADIKNSHLYWPEDDNGGSESDHIKEQAGRILAGASNIHHIIFKPPYKRVVRSWQQPLIVAPNPQDRFFYLAEFLTIVEGGKGQAPETDQLIAKDRDASPPEIVLNGLNLIDDTSDALDHIVGPSSSPRSLALPPALYFYSNEGRPVRSLL